VSAVHAHNAARRASMRMNMHTPEHDNGSVKGPAHSCPRGSRGLHGCGSGRCAGARGHMGTGTTATNTGYGRGTSLHTAPPNDDTAVPATRQHVQAGSAAKGGEVTEEP
jgi:hypothetical protein